MSNLTTRGLVADGKDWFDSQGTYTDKDEEVKTHFTIEDSRTRINVTDPQRKQIKMKGVKTVKYDGVIYDSITILAQDLDCTIQTVSAAIKRGMFREKKIEYV
jgi:uncharacterized protein YigE (DUF2233 family)